MLPHPPHDAFVRDFLADLDQARDFFRLTLPPAFQTEFNLDTLVAEPTSLIDETLSELPSDLTPRLQRRLAEADEATLQMWSLRLLTAATLEEVFPKASRRRPPA